MNIHPISIEQLAGTQEWAALSPKQKIWVRQFLARNQKPQ